ncbi:hypothetical protein [Allopontixanthobacter sp.]|uniref:hypothetical protein n=1 Tax=Allopontixanthobacter sp. TaxID=2906452 RepID=UPI002AB8F8F0|nr:hypothetical protein [Allopontixanthobacter sp.]MDZ4308910.1 hypothetical protein [Allopontixanthobacter sp.]
MSEFDTVQMISLLGFLILAGSALVGQRLNWKKGAVMALTWAGIFVMCFLFISLATS